MTENLSATGEHEEEQQLEVASLAVGRKLRDRREKLNMSLEDAASQLHLDVRLLQALENDDYSSLPGTAYAYGYLRSYAKLLKEPEQELLQQFQQVMDTESNALIPEHMTFAAKNKVPTFSLRQMFVIAILLILVGGAVAWVLLGSNLLQTSQQSAAETAVIVVPETPPGLSNAPTAEIENVVNDETVIESPLQIEEKKQDAQPDSERVNPVENRTEAIPAKDLQLSYESDSWTEVRDESGETLIYRMVNAGEQLELEGQGPYTILLGYAPGVTVTYKGSVFNTKPFQRDDIAYFRIGQPSPVLATEE